MPIRLILEFEDLSRSDVCGVADMITAEAENLTGESPWWRVEEAENESQA